MNSESETGESKTNATDGWDDEDWSPIENISPKAVIIVK